jgi:hypothetical protein
MYGLGLCLLVASNGCGREETSTRARNLATGEIQTFAGEVPPGFAPCTDPTCSIPPSVPCEQLGDAVCTLHPDCRLKELSCVSEGCACAACAPGATCPPCTCPPPKPPVCEYACIPKLPLLCSELTAEKDCLGRTDCEWAQLDCAMPCVTGQPCPPCGGGVCIDKPVPSTCQGLGEQLCKARPDCEWEALACTMECRDDGKGGCLPCDPAGTCQPKPVVPPPPTACKSALDCGKGQLCLFKSGCGQLGPGACTAIPQACPEYYSPVCGCDGKTYGNDCEAHGAGTSVAHVGACNIPPPPPAGCKSNADCAASNQFCLFKSGCGSLGLGSCVTRPQACAMYYSPVCGCDGKTYGNDCEAHGAGTSVAHAGACNVTPDPAVCAALEQKYAAALPAAKACNPLSMMPVLQCAFPMPTDLACHLCTTFVNNVTTLKAIESDWTAKGCDKLLRPCPAIACQAPAGATCESVAGTTAGVCKDVVK